MTKRRFIDPTQDIDRHVSESLGARSQRSITEELENAGRTPRTKRLRLMANGTHVAEIESLNITGGGVSTSVQGGVATATFNGNAPLVDVDYRTSGSGNITSTTGTNLSSLQASVVLTAGKIWDLFFEGSINCNAPAGDFIYAGCMVDGVEFGWTDTGTASGERALGFAGYKLGVRGDGAAHTANCRMKVGSGTGTVNSGWCKLVAVPR